MIDADFRGKRRTRLLAGLLVGVAALGLIGLCIAALRADPAPPLRRINSAPSWVAAPGLEEPEPGLAPARNLRWSAVPRRKTYL